VCPGNGAWEKRTVCLVVFVHEHKRVKVDVAMKVHIRPERGQTVTGECIDIRVDALYTPRIPEILQ
jgi:hypothetical protein